MARASCTPPPGRPPPSASTGSGRSTATEDRRPWCPPSGRPLPFAGWHLFRGGPRQALGQGMAGLPRRAEYAPQHPESRGPQRLLPNEQTTDIQPQWIGDAIYFLSDRDSTMNVWRYNPLLGTWPRSPVFARTSSASPSIPPNSSMSGTGPSTRWTWPNESTTLTIRVSGDFPGRRKLGKTSAAASAVSPSRRPESRP